MNLQRPVKVNILGFPVFFVIFSIHHVPATKKNTATLKRWGIFFISWGEYGSVQNERHPQAIGISLGQRAGSRLPTVGSIRILPHVLYWNCRFWRESKGITKPITRPSNVWWIFIWNINFLWLWISALVRTPTSQHQVVTWFFSLTDTKEVDAKPHNNQRLAIFFRWYYYQKDKVFL